MGEPLKIPLTKSQKPLVEQAIGHYAVKSLVKIGPDLVLNGNTFSVDPFDFCSVLDYMARTPENEMEVFRIRVTGRKLIEKRRDLCRNELSKRNYETLLKLLSNTEFGSSVNQPTIEEQRKNRPKQIAILP